MSMVAEIKEAIAKLSPREYCELMADLFPHADNDWDRQMKADAESGKLDFIDCSIRNAATNETAQPLAKHL